jgi:1-acyl-sn-glycerol-3-phosphate acyltransferase
MKSQDRELLTVKEVLIVDTPGGIPAGGAWEPGRKRSRESRTDREIARGPVARAFYQLSLFLSRITAIVLFDLRLHGARQVAAQGAVVVASNHQSYLDPWLVGTTVPRPSYYLARDTLFGLPIFRSILRWLNALPIPRKGAASRKGIELARAVLRAGKVLVLFPEGTRSRTGRMAPVKRGVDLVTRGSSAQVVPVLVDGTYRAWPPQKPLPEFRSVRVIYGRPFPAGAPAGEGTEGRGPAEGAAAGKNELSADLVARLEAAYRSLEARARKVRWAGAIPSRRGAP